MTIKINKMEEELKDIEIEEYVERQQQAMDEYYMPEDDEDDEVEELAIKQSIQGYYSVTEETYLDDPDD